MVHRRDRSTSRRASRSRSCSASSGSRQAPTRRPSWRCSRSRARPSGPACSSDPGPTIETVYDADLEDVEYAIEVSFEGTYDLDEATLTDGSLLDEHFAAMGGWIASTLVKLGDLHFEFLPPEDEPAI